MSDTPTIHRFPAKHEGAFVNAHLVETEAGVVAVDGLLTSMSSLEIDEAVRSSVGDGRSLYTVDAELIDSLAPNVILTQDLCAVRRDHVNHDG